MPHYISTAIRHPKRVFSKIDQIIFGGRIKRRLLKDKQKKLYPQHSTIAVSDLILAQFSNEHFADYRYFDFAHRLFAIEQFYGKNSFGYELYRKMQDISGGHRWDESWLRRFQNLIREYDKTKTYDGKHPIICFANNWQIKDGAHRLSLAYYHGEEFLPVEIESTCHDRRWSYNWLWAGEFGEEKFTIDEIQKITEKTKQIFDDITYDFVGIIWPPAMPYKDEIINDLNRYGELAAKMGQPCGECHVMDYCDAEYDKADFLGLMRMLYHEDIITEANLIRKYNLILSAMPEGTEKFPVRLFSIHIDHPCIERREENNSAQSRSVVNIKKAIRTRYKDRIPDYQYDICFHLSDNYQQSKFCKIGAEMSRDVSELFENLNKRWEYVICKTEKRIAPNFPYYYYYYSDADILINKEDMAECADFIEKWLKQKYTDSWFHVDRVFGEETLGIILKLRGLRIIYFDLQTTEHFGMSSNFNTQCIENRCLSTNKGFYFAPPPFDMIIRTSEYARNTHKTWHREYIKEHINEYDENLFNVAFPNMNDDLAKHSKQVINDIQNEQ